MYVCMYVYSVEAMRLELQILWLAKKKLNKRLISSILGVLL